MNKSAGQALAEFVNVAIGYIGKEIKLLPTEYFSIEYNITNEEMPMYQFQYGFPQSGCVSLSIISEGEYQGKVSKVLVTAPSADREFVSVVVNNDKDLVEGLNVGLKFGVDMNFDKHTNFAEIEENPNAIKMIELATRGLSKAVVLGESQDVVAKGSKFLPAGRSV